MNRQPFQTPPKTWAPKLKPWLVRLWRPLINRTLREGQKIASVDVQGIEQVQQALASGAGLLVTPNHSFHYDSFVIFHVADQVDRPFHIMTAWQVFEMSSRLERWMLQRHGCFSVDREGADRRALKQAIEILRDSPHPLVIFPAGVVYHTNDRGRPFRERAAAFALSGA